MKKSVLLTLAMILTALAGATVCSAQPTYFRLYDTDCWQYDCTLTQADFNGQSLYTVVVTTALERTVQGLLFYDPTHRAATITLFEMASTTGDRQVVPSQTLEGIWTGRGSTFYIVVENGFLASTRVSTQPYTCEEPPAKAAAAQPSREAPPGAN